MPKYNALLTIPLNRAIFALAAACIMVPLPAAIAQDLPPAEIAEKENRKMDSRLAELYDSAAAGYVRDALDQELLLSPDGKHVQVILVMSSADALVPQGLGIAVETAYEELVQATVPIMSLQSIASDENVQFVKVPARPVPAANLVAPEYQDGAGFEALYLLAIPAAAAPVIAGIIIWQRRR